MVNTLIFNKIQRGNIFNNDFINFDKNNKIEFKKIGRNNIAVIYGPNGTGKTSLSVVLGGKEDKDNISFDVDFNGTKYTQDNNELFYVISDQNGRNIIRGSARDYLLGDNIKREYDLKDYISKEFILLQKDINKLMKSSFNISSMKNVLINQVENTDLRVFVRNFANSRFKVEEQLDKSKFLDVVKSLNKEEINITLENEEKYIFIKNNFKYESSLIYRIMNINDKEIKKNEEILKIEENDEALNILSKFKYKDECIVCDNKDYNREELIERKTSNKESIIKSLDPITKKILEDIIQIVKTLDKDPLKIEEIFVKAIETGDKNLILELKNEILIYIKLFNNEINNLFKDLVKPELIKRYDEYMKILESQPTISDEDILYIEKIVSENIRKSIEIKRDTQNGNNLKILLGGKEFLDKDRDELQLSTGQQNFISLSFELLKAKNSDKEIIILDDPISSFDSIYKNKIAFCIIKFLEGKNQIILTHNTDLIRLLEFQLQNCFNLYLFNNSENAINGFIKVNLKEKDILLQINKLLDLFRTNIFEEVRNQKHFLISMIPFMRGYANITGKRQEYTNLSKVMHGYENEKIDILKIYNNLFLDDDVKLSGKLEVSVDDILELDLENIRILKEDSEYQLLDNTLYHTLSYLYLRLKVEKDLIDIYNVMVNGNMTVQQIIMKAFTPSNGGTIEDKIFFTSRKTLLNEFNHFEGNMNIFQPAIDITDIALNEEKESILDYLEKLRKNKEHMIETELEEDLV